MAQRFITFSFAAAVAIIAGCSHSGSGLSSSNAAPPPTTTVLTSSGATCGVYVGTPTADQLLDAARTEKGQEWDATPEIQKMMPRDQYLDRVTQFATAKQAGQSALVDYLPQVPHGGTEKFERYLCAQADELELHAYAIEHAGENASLNLLSGLFLCQKLASGIESPPADDNIEFDETVRLSLCPQVPSLRK